MNTPAVIREHVVKRLTRSGRWPAVRRAAIARDGGKCLACGRRRWLQVHHRVPVHVAPERELDMGNLLTLCSRCHLLLGHLNNWRRYNKAVVWIIGEVGACFDLKD